MIKSYNVICPDCDNEFTTGQDPALLATGDADLITCPECGEEWEYEYIHETDEIELMPDEEDDFFDEDDVDEDGLPIDEEEEE